MAGPPGPKFDQSPRSELFPDASEEQPADAAETVITAYPAPDMGGESLPGEPDAAYLPSEAPEGEPPPEPSADDWYDASGTQLLNGEAHAVADPAAEQWMETTEVHAQENGEDSESSSPFPIRRSLYKRPEPVPTADEELAQTIAFLQRLQVRIQQVEATAEAPSLLPTGLTVLQAKRMTRTGVTPDPFEIGVLPKPWTPPPEPVPDPVAFPGEAAPPTDSAQVAVPMRLRASHAIWLVLIGGLCLVTLGLVAYVWTRVLPLSRLTAAPRSSSGHGAPAGAPAPDVSEEALNVANLALEAMQHNDLKRASEILAGAQKQGLALPGLFYQAGLLAFNQGQPDQADDFLERSIAVNDSVADCWYLRANAAFFKEGPNKAAEELAEAISAAPFSPRYYFFRAECLRRHGNSAAALSQFQEALRCRPNSADTDLILFKIGLTKIEANTDLIFKTELRDRLAQEPVSGDTLLLAAADAISHNDFPEAAENLRRAALALPPRVFQSRARDYVYQLQAKQPEIAAVLKLTLPTGGSNQPAPPHATHILIDPATRSLAEADPAGW